MVVGLQPKRVGPGVFVAGLAAWAVAAGVFFRHPLKAQFASVLGDPLDGRMIVFVHEHLFRALQGGASFLSPPMYYPQRGVLGFSDAFVLDILPYALPRFMGFDPFLAFQLMAIGLSLACFAASLAIGVRYLKLRPWIAIAAAALVTFPHNLYFKAAAGHLNFLSFYHLPPIILVALWGLEDFPHLGARALLRIAAAAVLYALLFATVYNVAWLFTFTMLIAAGAVAAMRRAELVLFVRAHRRPLLVTLGVAGGAFVIGLVPFLLIHVPVALMFAGRRFWEYLAYAPLPKDVINVSIWNLVWGDVVERFVAHPGGEFSLAVTPAMAAMLLVLALRQRGAAAPGGHWQTVFALACAVVWAASWLLTMRIGKYSLFWVPFHVFPGGSGVRTGARIQLVVNIWVAFGLAVTLEQWIARAGATLRRQLVAAAILAFCLVEQVSVLDNANLPRTAELARLASIPDPPAACRAFIVDRPAGNALPANLKDASDAMWIALKTGLPTLNGSTGWWPEGWRLFYPHLDYFTVTREWIAQSGLTEQVCLYDRPTRTWSEFR